MDISRLRARFDLAIRVVLYILLFWIPYSPAVIEICVILGLSLFFIKRLIVPQNNIPNGKFYFIHDLAIALTLKRNPLNKPILLFLLIAFFSASLSPYGNQALSAFFRKILEWFVIFYLVFEVFTEKKHIQMALVIVLFTTLGVIVDGFVQFYLTCKDIFFGKEVLSVGITASFNHPNSLGAYLALLIPLAAALAADSKAVIWRNIAVGFFVILTVWLLVLTASRAACIAAFAGIFFLLFFLRRRFLCWFLAGILSCALLFYFLSSPDSRYKLKLENVNIQSTVAWRLGVWQDSWEMVQQKPWIGHGPGTYMKNFQHYRRGGSHYNPTYAHNCYLQMAAEVGILSLLAFLSILAAMFKRVFQNFHGEEQDRQLHLIFWGLAAGIVAFLVHSFFDINFYSLQLSSIFWFIMGLFISTDRLLNRSNLYSVQVATY